VPTVAGAAGPFVGKRAARTTGYPPVIWLLLGGNLMVRAAGFAYPFLAFYVADRGHAAGAVGAVLATFGAGWLVGQLVCGWLIDRIGRRSTLVATGLSAGVVLALMAEARSVPALLAGAAVVGLVYEAPRTVLAASIADLVADPKRRAKIDALRFSWMSIGAGAAGAAGGLLAGWMGIAALYWINGIACAAFAIVAACWMPSSAPRAKSTGKTIDRQAFSDARLVLLFVSSVAALTAFMGFYAAMPMLMSESGLGPGAYGWAQLANAAAVVALTPLIKPWLSRRVEHSPRVDILAAAILWTTICVGAIGLAHTALGFTLAAVACAPGEIAWFVVGAGIVHRIAPPTHRGRYHGIWGLAGAVAAVIAPILASWSLLHGGRALVAATTVAVGLIGAALCLPLAHALARRFEAPTEMPARAAATRPESPLPAVDPSAVHAGPSASRAVCQCLDLRSSLAVPRGYGTSTPTASLGHRLTSP
jgi:MFS family permease